MADVAVRTEFPHATRVIEHVWIPLADGARLAARIWLPVEAEKSPVPAILEYLPYRKNDGTTVGDYQQMGYFAGCGYAGVRVDIRGSGDSDGILEDEYLPLEQADCLDVIAWLAEQPWCDGSVGMIGYSWGGFNSLQVAALGPTALKAIITVYSTDDRYGDDVHYRGGTVLGMDMLPWANAMLSFMAQPPDPAFVGEGWRERWLDRLERTPPYIEAWLAHQRRDAYWKQGSVCENYSAIRCPVFAVGGWADGYTDAVLRLLAGLSVPRKGLIGPWGHNDPVHGNPKPAAGVLGEYVRWWDRWLKGIENGIMDEPMLRAWRQEWVQPRGNLDERPGRWVAEETWPSPRIEARELAFGDGTLGTDGTAVEMSLRGSQLCGIEGGAWCADGHSDDVPLDQRAEDGRSLCFTSRPLDAPLEILGFAEAALELSVDRPQALVCARLCDVAPDGTSLLVTRGILNLTHRGGHDRPEPLEPGRPYTVRVQLDSIAHRFEAGHRLRLAVSPTYWPIAWPSPEPVTLTVYTGGCRLTLPVRPPRPEDDALQPLPPPEEPPEHPWEQIRRAAGGRRVLHELGPGRVELVFDWDAGGLFRLPQPGLEHEDSATVTYSIVEGDPLSARVECTNGFVCRGPGWDTCGTATGVMTSTATHFHVTTALEVSEGQTRVWAKSWTFAFPRDHC